MKILKEARTFNYNTQKEKMYGYETGTRGLSGLTTMSEDKCKYNLMVCAKEGYEKAKQLILNRMVELGMFVDAIKNRQYNFLFFGWPSEISGSAYVIGYLESHSLEQFINSNYLYCDSYGPMWVCKALFCAMLALFAVNAVDYATKIKDELVRLGFDVSDIKNAVNKALNDKDALDEIEKIKNNATTNKLEEDIEKHETLNPKLWTKDNTLKSEVEEKIKLIVNEFLDGLEKDEIVFDIADVVLVGSNCSYNYTKDSDLDIHILVNLDNSDCPKNLYDKLYSAYRTIFNNRLDIDFYGIPVEIYVEDKNNTNISNGKYSVVNKKWIKEPVAEDIPEIDQEKFNKEFKVWEDRYNEVINMK